MHTDICHDTWETPLWCSGFRQTASSGVFLWIFKRVNAVFICKSTGFSRPSKRRSSCSDGANGGVNESYLIYWEGITIVESMHQPREPLNGMDEIKRDEISSLQIQSQAVQETFIPSDDGSGQDDRNSAPTSPYVQLHGGEFSVQRLTWRSLICPSSSARCWLPPHRCPLLGRHVCVAWCSAG